MSGTYLCFLESPWLFLSSGIKGVQGDYLYSCHTPAAHPCLPSNMGAAPVYSVSHAAAPFECRTASLVPYVHCFSNTLHNSSNEQMTCACLLLVTYIGLQKVSQRTTHEYLLICASIAEFLLGPDKTTE